MPIQRVEDLQQREFQSLLRSLSPNVHKYSQRLKTEVGPVPLSPQGSTLEMGVVTLAFGLIHLTWKWHTPTVHPVSDPTIPFDGTVQRCSSVRRLGQSAIGILILTTSYTKVSLAFASPRVRAIKGPRTAIWRGTVVPYFSGGF